MKRLLLLSLLAFSVPSLADDTPFDWSGLERSKISLEAPLLIVKGSLGFLGCGYINTDSCIDEACAVEALILGLGTIYPRNPLFSLRILPITQVG